MADLIQILVPGADGTDTFPWQFTDDTGKRFDTEFLLRQVPDELEAKLRRKHTRVSYHRGQKREDFQYAPYLVDILDYAITGWDKLIGLVPDGKGGRTKVDLPCSTANRALLPEKLKMEVVRICVGKEAGEFLGALDTDAAPDPVDGSKS